MPRMKMPRGKIGTGGRGGGSESGRGVLNETLARGARTMPIAPRPRGVRPQMDTRPIRTHDAFAGMEAEAYGDPAVDAEARRGLVSESQIARARSRMLGSGTGPTIDPGGAAAGNGRRQHGEPLFDPPEEPFIEDPNDEPANSLDEDADSGTEDEASDYADPPELTKAIHAAAQKAAADIRQRFEQIEQIRQGGAAVVDQARQRSVPLARAQVARTPQLPPVNQGRDVVPVVHHPPAAGRQGIFAEAITLADVDHLWDWLRQDPDLGAHFFGRTFDSSLALHAFTQQLLNAEQHGIAAIRAVYWDGHHVGFAMLAPVMAEERIAVMHIYLRQDIRGQIAAVTPHLVESAQAMLPGIHLAVASTSPAFARLHRQLLVPLGFREETLFIR